MEIIPICLTSHNFNLVSSNIYFSILYVDVFR